MPENPLPGRGLCSALLARSGRVSSLLLPFVTNSPPLCNQQPALNSALLELGLPESFGLEPDKTPGLDAPEDAHPARLLPLLLLLEKIVKTAATLQAG